MIGIYKIENLINGKVYIGQSRNIEKRWIAHRNTAFNKNSDGYEYPLYRAIRKYGIDNFSFNVLEECEIDELDEKEIEYIAYYDSYKNGYNQDEGGSQAIHFQKLSKDKVLNIISILRNSFDSSETIGEKFGVSGRVVRAINNGESCAIDGMKYPIRQPIWGKNVQKEVCEEHQCPICGKMTSNFKYCSQECSEIGQRKSKRPEPLELARLIKENGFMKTGKLFGVDGNAIKSWCKSYGIPHLKDDLIKWYNSEIGLQDEIIVKQEKIIKDQKKKVSQIDTVTGRVLNIFESAGLAARSLGKKSSGHICEACNGILDIVYGYRWKYI